MVMPLKPREGRLLGLAAATALALGVYFYVVEPLVVRARETEGLTRAREASLERRRLLVGQRARLTAELDAVTKQLDSEALRLLRGPTAPLAASELQAMINDVAGNGSIEVRSERVLPPRRWPSTIPTRSLACTSTWCAPARRAASWR